LDAADRAINAISAMFLLKSGQIEKGIDVMNVFVKDCGYDLDIHDNQTIWFEQMSGRAHYEAGNLRESLKQFNHVITHLEHMQ